jgi:hypothetical protein
MGAASRLWPEQDATGFHYFDFLHACGSPLHALFYSGLFWPQFIEFEGMIFLEGTIEDESDRQRVREAFRQYGGDRTKTEQSFNSVEVPSLFGGRAAETTEREDEFLASRICAMWTARLRELFPDRRFVVEMQRADETGGEIAVRFYQLA